MNHSEQLPDKPDKATILAVLQLLRKYNLKTTIKVMKKEADLDITVPGSHEPNQNESEVGIVFTILLMRILQNILNGIYYGKIRNFNESRSFKDKEQEVLKSSPLSTI